MTEEEDDARLERARYEEAAHATANVVAARSFPNDRLVSIRVSLNVHHELTAYVETNRDTEITTFVLSRLQKGYVLSDECEARRVALSPRIRAKVVMSVAGQFGVQMFQGRQTVPTLQEYAYPDGYWQRMREEEDEFGVSTWRLRDRDKVLLLAFYSVSTDRSLIAVAADAPLDRDVLRLVSDAYAESESLREAIIAYVAEAEKEAEALLKTHWTVVNAFVVALRSTSSLSWEDVSNILTAFPSLAI